MVPARPRTEGPPGFSESQPAAQGGQRGKAGGQARPGTFCFPSCLRSLHVLSLSPPPHFALLTQTHSSDVTQLSLPWEGSVMVRQARLPLPSKPAPPPGSLPATSMELGTGAYHSRLMGRKQRE